jgi:hypothetical protein
VIDAAEMEAPVTDEAPARQKPGPKPKPQPDLSSIAAMIQDAQAETRAQIESLAARVEAAEAKADAVSPQFVPTQIQTWGNRDLERAPNGFDGLADLAIGQEVGGSRQRLPISSKEGLIPPDVARRMPQRFRRGQHVRINPQATRPGAERTWGEVLATEKAKRWEPTGVVRDCVFHGGDGWKYQVKIVGMTGARDHQDGFYESELLPA